LENQIAFVIHPELRGKNSSRPVELMLNEAISLSKAIGLKVVHSEVVNLSKLQASSYVGKGVAGRLARLALNYNTNNDGLVVIVNTGLSPVQHRNLETLIKTKVIDRTQLILEIFGARAKSSVGRLQVELASLSFQRSRLVRSWTHLERQRGGAGFLGGPGERQIELDRRMLLSRVRRVKSMLIEAVRTRKLQQQNRLRSEKLIVAIIGYTNAGKSTLFNALTGANVLSKNMLFATLDPTMRELNLLSGRKVILTDTVGFISHLPTELIEAFKSTLEEVVHADVLLHVHDVSSPMVAEEAKDVAQVLADLGLEPDVQKECVLHVLNKADLTETEEDEIKSLKNLFPGAIVVSALKGHGIDNLLRSIDHHFERSELSVNFKLAPSDGAARAWLYENGHVTSSGFDDNGYELIKVNIGLSDYARLCSRWPCLINVSKI